MRTILQSLQPFKILVLFATLYALIVIKTKLAVHCHTLCLFYWAWRHEPNHATAILYFLETQGYRDFMHGEA
jgi:hypothetical protein